ncbi:MAG: enoyl-CoA hydratase, partial [Myxococcales bacterium]|nr:enoyl-CoA hydratase [Myxococcales bacterium]
AIEGVCVAGGLELALWCDLRVSSETARFGVFCRRVGVPLIDGGTVRLPRLIGASRAMDLILTGREVDAREADQIGLVNRLVPRGQARSSAEALASALASFPQATLRADLCSARRAFEGPMEELMKDEVIRAKDALELEASEGARRFGARPRFEAED